MKNNLYLALMMKFGSLAEAAKALKVSRKSLEQKTNRGSNLTIAFAHKVIEALGIQKDRELINLVLFEN